MFLRLICKKVVQNVSSRTTIHGSTSKIHHHHVYFVHTQSFKSNSTNYHSPTVSYLVEKCGLSLDSAISASKRIYRNIESTEKPDSVLQLFKQYGFTQTQIANLITKRPQLILADSVKTLKPKFEYFESSLSFSKPDIVSIVESNGNILCTSLTNGIVPTVNLLKSFLHTNAQIITVLKICSRFSLQLAPNITTLQQQGVPDCNISKFIMLQPLAFMRENKHFKEMVREIEEIGFEPNTRSFVHSLSVRCSMTKSTWEYKVEVYKSFGWSEEDVVSAFKLQPSLMVTSEKKIRKLMDFYLNELGLQSSHVAKNPNLMMVSLEKRIIPRCSVLQVLLLKGLIEKNLNLTRVFKVTENSFNMKYVNKYHETAPEVLKAYQGELGYPKLETLRSMLGCAE